MAENKKSFILYADLIHTVRKMPKDKAGELFLTILSYVNDENPICDDILVDLVFEPVKRQLKRDLESWEIEKVNKSTFGIIGNLKRWHPELYKKYLKGKLSIEEAVKIANDRTPIYSDKKESQPIANIAVNVTDTVTLYKSEDSKKYVIDLKQSVSWIGVICMKEKVQPYQVQEGLDAFYLHLAATEEYHPNLSSVKRHFSNWFTTHKPVSNQSNL